jgi:hypothetical protein
LKKLATWLPMTIKLLVNERFESATIVDRYTVRDSPAKVSGRTVVNLGAADPWALFRPADFAEGKAEALGGEDIDIPGGVFRRVGMNVHGFWLQSGAGAWKRRHALGGLEHDDADAEERAGV